MMMGKHVQDRIRGSLVAGAAGDALGYAVEFMSLTEILRRYGKGGIRRFQLNQQGKALVSDDTQMTLFTANGMLMGLTRGAMRGIGGRPEDYVQYAYMDWYYTQTHRSLKQPDERYTWLAALPELYACRAPGNTCMQSCEKLVRHEKVKNHSRGCGGIMRVAPMGLMLAAYASRGEMPYSYTEMMEAGGAIAAVTHQHPLGFLPAALLTHLLFRLVLTPVKVAEVSFPEIVKEGLRLLSEIYPEQYIEEKQELVRLTHLALDLAKSSVSDVEAIAQLGEGWTGEEAWAIAVFCSARHISAIHEAIIAAVNHNGDSDSTGSVTGNIMGAIYGYQTIAQTHQMFCPGGHRLETALELMPVILALADDLEQGCIISEYEPIDTPAQQQWHQRYCEMLPVGL